MNKRKGITKKQAKRRRFFTRFLFIVILIGITYILFFKTSLFNIKSIEVEGNKKVKAEDIVKQSTYKENFKVFSFKKKDGIKNINKIPYIDTVDIKIKYPIRIFIKVKERDPIAKVAYMDKVLLIDETGRVLETIDREKELAIPEISGLDLNNIKDGENVFSGKYKSEYLDFLKISRDINILSKIKYINLFDIDNIILELKTSEKIYIGNISDLEYKFNFLQTILKDVKKKNIQVKSIEFNKGENPVVITDDGENFLDEDVDGKIGE